MKWRRRILAGLGITMTGLVFLGAVFLLYFGHTRNLYLYHPNQVELGMMETTRMGNFRVIDPGGAGLKVFPQEGPVIRQVRLVHVRPSTTGNEFLAVMPLCPTTDDPTGLQGSGGCHVDDFAEGECLRVRYVPNLHWDIAVWAERVPGFVCTLF